MRKATEQNGGCRVYENPILAENLFQFCIGTLNLKKMLTHSKMEEDGQEYLPETAHILDGMDSEEIKLLKTIVEQ